jgi:hypothetical protein
MVMVASPVDRASRPIQAWIGISLSAKAGSMLTVLR